MMREVVPFTDRFTLQQAIDNGGRFYHLFSKSNDEIVTAGELSKAAGTFHGRIPALLFLELAMWDLSPHDQAAIVDLLEPGLRERYVVDRPTPWRPSQVDSEGVANSSVIVTAKLRFVKDESMFTGFVTVPIFTGNTTVYSQVPLHTQYNLYELFDDDQMQGQSCIAATDRDQPLEHHGPVRLGGILRDLQSGNEAGFSHNYYLETWFYTKLEDGRL